MDTPQALLPNKIAGNSLWFMVEKLLGLLSGLAIGILVARYLGPEQFGALAFAMAITSIMLPISKLGLDSIVVRDIVKEPQKGALILSNALKLRLAATLLAIPVMVFIAWALGQSPTVISIVAILGLANLIRSCEVLELYFRSQMRLDLSSKIGMLALSISALSKIGLVLATASLLFFALPLLLEALALAVLCYLFFRKIDSPLLSFKLHDTKQMKGMLSDGLPLLLSAFLAAILLDIDQLLLAHFSGDATVGTYKIAVTMITATYFFAMAISRSSFPLLIKLSTEKPAQFIWLMQSLSLGLTLIGYAGICVIWLFGSPIILLLYGEDFLESVQVLSILSFGLPIVYLGFMRNIWNRIHNIIRFELIATLLATAFNITLNIALIPHFGSIGAAWVTVASYGIAYFLANSFHTESKAFFLIQCRSFLIIPACLHLIREKQSCPDFK